ncbi:MAG: NAD(P)/FAD-dependent oxidoreductase [Alphaproteobacteria bacterium]|nr:NAD(P)/FAD-dependent oxidoreductase [Alphaproteobacteria bacterium]
MQEFDVVIIGAGAAGMMCAVEAGARGRRVLLLDHAKSLGEKIRISGGGRCNFTNLDCRAEAFLSQNPKFAISALSRFSQWDFIDRIEAEGIAWHEKTLGQLFCDGSATQIIEMFARGMAAVRVEIGLRSDVGEVRRDKSGFTLRVAGTEVKARSVVIATGGLSIPKIGASGFGYDIARQFELAVEETRAGLVPLTFAPHDLAKIKPLAGLSVDAIVATSDAQFREGLLFTHRGLSGPSVLQISSYWREGRAISVDLMPGQDMYEFFRARKSGQGGQVPATVLSEVLPKRLARMLCQGYCGGKTLANLTEDELRGLADLVSNWAINPAGTEGYRTAEVTCGGVSTNEINARTMEARKVPGLYFIGEVVDVTGWLGGYNFQWAWSSGWAAGQVV